MQQLRAYVKSTGVLSLLISLPWQWNITICAILALFDHRILVKRSFKVRETI